MKNLGRMEPTIVALVFLMLCVSPGIATAALDCDRAEALFQKASLPMAPAARAGLLEQAVQLCPTHASAWQNLGTTYQRQQRFEAAAEAYAQAHRHDPALGTPLAGLGDVALVMGRFEEAGRHFRQFLAFLEQEAQRGDPRGLTIFQDEYEDKLTRADLKLQILTSSLDTVVSKAVLTRGLKPIAMERLTLCIHFDFNSAELTERGRAQLSELAAAMLDPDLRNQTYLIEGHTDLFGEHDYNNSLSQRRAGEVRNYLASRGVAPERLQTEGRGKTRPLVTAGDKRAQRVNRRVEFVQMGAMPP